MAAYRTRRAVVIVTDLCGYTERLRQDEDAALFERDRWRVWAEECAEVFGNVRVDHFDADNAFFWTDDLSTARAFLSYLLEWTSWPFSAAFGEGPVRFGLTGRFDGLTVSEVCNLAETVAGRPGEVREWASERR